MDMSKVFISEGAIPPHLLEKVKRSLLKVELCDDCSRLNETFSRLFRKWEKAEIELASCQRKSAKKFANVRRDGDEFYKLTKCEPTDAGLLEKLKIAEALRKDAVQKCNQKMKMEVKGPRIRVKRLSPEDIPPKKAKRGHWSRDQDPVFGETDALARGNLKDDSYHWDVSDNMEVDDTTSDSYQSVMTMTMPAQRKTIDKSQHSVSSGTGKVKCNLCLKEFAYYRGFHRHYKAVHLKFRLKCQICYLKFSRRDSLILHHRNVHSGLRVKARANEKNSRRQFDASVSDSMEVDVAIADSYHSGQTMSLQKNVIDKSKYCTNSATGKVKCNLCRKEFGIGGGFHRHYLNAHLKVRFKCNICHADFGRKDYLRRHLQLVHKQRAKGQFRSKTSTDANQRLHRTEAGYDKCNSRYEMLVDVNERTSTDDTEPIIKNETDTTDEETNRLPISKLEPVKPEESSQLSF